MYLNFEACELQLGGVGGWVCGAWDGVEGSFIGHRMQVSTPCYQETSPPSDFHLYILDFNIAN